MNIEEENIIEAVKEFMGVGKYMQSPLKGNSYLYNTLMEKYGAQKINSLIRKVRKGELK